MFEISQEIEARIQNEMNCVDVLIKRLKELKEKNVTIANLRRETILHTRCGINGNLFSIIIDS